MDHRFLPAVAAIREGNTGALASHLEAEPTLATQRSSCSHPTLMQCLVLDGVNHETGVQIAMAEALLEHGSVVDEPLIAAASVGNVILGRWLLDHGAALDGDPSVLEGWTPLEESLYWGFPGVTELLLERGAAIPNLRAAAGLGKVEEMRRFFDESGELRENAGGIFSPFGSLDGESSERPQLVLDNALTHAAVGGHRKAAGLLLDRGADVNSHPLGFHYRGTALHWAAIRGQRKMCELSLERGADPTIEDLTIRSSPADWASHDGHEDLADLLSERAAPAQPGAAPRTGPA